MNDPNHGSDSYRHHVGPFVTWATEKRSDELALLHTSRRERKGLPPLAVQSTDETPDKALRTIHHQWVEFWAPRRMGWWTGVLFVVGSALFAVGGAMGAWPDMPLIRLIDEGHVGWIFFVGSLFFTSAGILQLLEVINGDVDDVATSRAAGKRRRLLFAWRPRNIGYVAVVAQLIGMLFFNLNTADAMIAGLDWVEEDILVWTPNLVGSILFLIASHASIIEVSHRYWRWRFDDLSWWITFLNMIGSIFFMISALASFTEPGDVLVAPWLANFGTFAGAICFLVGGYLLIPEQFEKVATGAD